jgi:iron complex outermembrane recepter protein
MHFMNQRIHFFNKSKVYPVFLIGLACVLSQAASSQVLQEIVVNAQLREENIQDVPVAVSAFSGDFLEENSIKDVIELMTSVPGLIVGTNQSSSTGNFSIRGVGTGAQNFGLESSVGLYVDGIYRARQSSMINQLVDVEAIEVLRGPQGTLFGKNSASGAVLVRSVAPSHEQNAFIEASVGEYSLLNLSAGFNFSLNENIAARTTVFSSERDGYINVQNLGEDVNDRSRIGFKQQFLYEPATDFSARVIIDYSKIDEACCAALTLKDSFIASGRTDSAGGPVPGSDYILSQFGGTVYRSGSFDNRQMSLNSLPSSESDDKGISLEINKAFSGFDFTSISAYRAFDTKDFIDADFSDIDLATRSYGAEQKMFSQEFRIASDSSQRLRYLAGAYFYSQEIESSDFINFGQFLPSYVTAASPDVLGALIATPPALLGYINAIHGTAFGPSFATPILAGNQIQDASDQDHDANAIFGRIDYDLTDNLQLNVGLRYTDESKSMSSRFSEAQAIPSGASLNVAAIGAALAISGAQAKQAAGAPSGDGTGNTYNEALAGLDATPYLPALNVLYSDGWATCTISTRFCPRPNIATNLDDSRVTGNIGLSWRADDSTMIYGSFGTGYKSGGTNTDRIGLGFDAIFNSEDTETFELGLKKDFLRNTLRMNIAVYDMQVEDLQTNTFTGTAFNLQNAGKVDVQGLEAEVWWNPTDSLSFFLAYAKTDAVFNDFAKGNCQVSNIFHTGNSIEASQYLTQGFCNRDGDRVSNVSDDYVSLNVAKSFYLDNGTEVVIGGDYIYYSDEMMHSNNDPFANQDAKTLLNLKAIVRFTSDIEAMLWIRNVADESYYGTVFDTPLQDGKLSAYPREPRTYGLTVRKNF